MLNLVNDNVNRKEMCNNYCLHHFSGAPTIEPATIEPRHLSLPTIELPTTELPTVELPTVELPTVEPFIYSFDEKHPSSSLPPSHSHRSLSPSPRWKTSTRFVFTVNNEIFSSIKSISNSTYKTIPKSNELS
jgi:hypothetical protein